MARLLLLLGYVLVVGCSTPTGDREVVRSDDMVYRDSVVTYSLLGKPLKHVPETATSYARKDSQLQVALANYKEDSGSLENIIWYGRRLAYLTEYPQALHTYTIGLHIHPKSPELYRHRGHRYVSMRKFDEAIDDLTIAAALMQGREVEIEPDGQPNKLNKPLSSLQFNVWYHLGLAYYLTGQYTDAAKAYDSCLVYSTNPDLLCATTDWYYMTCKRLGDSTKARELLEPIHAGMEIIENDAYHQRLLMYKGEITPESLLSLDEVTLENQVDVVTQGYGVANYYLSTGEKAKAKRIMEKILETDYWPAFGYIAAEVDLANGL